MDEVDELEGEVLALGVLEDDHGVDVEGAALLGDEEVHVAALLRVVLLEDVLGVALSDPELAGREALGEGLGVELEEVGLPGLVDEAPRPP